MADLRRSRARGIYSPKRLNGRANTLFICSTLKPGGRDRLVTTIHETLHASMPHASEETVERVALDVAAVLIKVGYRLEWNAR